MTEAIQRELEALATAREERERLSLRVRALESERETLERTIERADAEVDETTLDECLARLRSIERERTTAQQTLDRHRDLEERYAMAIHRKYERLSGSDHPVLQAIAPLFERGHALRTRLAALDQHVHFATDAEHHLRLLRDALGQADTAATADVLTSVLPLPVDAAFAVGKHRLIREAHGHGARAKDALLQLSEATEARRAAEQAPGPTPPFGLDDEDVRLLDVLSSDIDLWTSYSISKWRYGVRRLLESTTRAKREMLEQRNQLELDLAAVTTEYQRLIASA